MDSGDSRFRVPLLLASLWHSHQLLKAIEKPLTGRTGRAALQHTSCRQKVTACEHQLQPIVPGILALGALSIKHATIARVAVVQPFPPPPGGSSELQLLSENE